MKSAVGGDWGEPGSAERSAQDLRGARPRGRGRGRGRGPGSGAGPQLLDWGSPHKPVCSCCTGWFWLQFVPLL